MEDEEQRVDMAREGREAELAHGILRQLQRSRLGTMDDQRDSNTKLLVAATTVDRVHPRGVSQQSLRARGLKIWFKQRFGN